MATLTLEEGRLKSRVFIKSRDLFDIVQTKSNRSKICAQRSPRRQEVFDEKCCGNLESRDAWQIDRDCSLEMIADCSNVAIATERFLSSSNLELSSQAQIILSGAQKTQIRLWVFEGGGSSFVGLFFEPPLWIEPNLCPQNNAGRFAQNLGPKKWPSIKKPTAVLGLAKMGRRLLDTSSLSNEPSFLSQKEEQFWAEEILGRIH